MESEFSKEQLEKLLKSIEAGNCDVNPYIPTPIAISEIDTSQWKEFGNFFFAPKIDAINYVLSETISWNESINRRIPCTYLSCTDKDLNKAIEILRKDLLVLRKDKDIVICGFLQYPCHVPAVDNQHIAFCFLFGYKLIDRYSENGSVIELLTTEYVNNLLNSSSTGEHSNTNPI